MSMAYRIFLDAFDYDPKATPIPPAVIKQSRDECRHTPAPTGYVEWHRWAEDATKAGDCC